MPSETRREALMLAATVAAAVAVFLSAAWPNAANTVDDAWITVRCVDHLLAGHGPLYNDGEWVESFSDPAWLLMLAGGMRAGLDPLALMLAAGLAFGVATIVLAAALVSAITGRLDHRSGLAALGVGASPHLAILATNGLESTMWTAAVAGACLAATTGRGAWVVGLLPWVRPEGTFLAPLLGLVGAVRTRNRWLWTAQVVAPWLALHGLRAVYFGTFMANPVTAKAHFTDLPSLVASNARYLARDGATWVVVALVAAGAVAAPPRRWDRAIPVAAALFLAGALVRAPEWMPGARVVAPLWVAGVVGAMTSELSWLRVATVTAALGLAITPVATEARAYDWRNTAAPENAAALAGRWLADHLPADSNVVMRDAGVLARALGTDVRVFEIYPAPLTRRGPRPRLPEGRPAVLVTTVQGEEMVTSEYPTDKAMLERGRWRHLGRVEQHYRRYYDVWAAPGVDLPPLPEELTTPLP
jgi:arabinofuranosyltransferase